MPILVQEVKHEYGTRTVLHGLSFAIKPGEVVGLLGPNGAGKTTLTRLVVGLFAPAGGSIRVFGLDPFAHPRQVKSRIGVVHQRSNFDWELSVQDNLENYGALFGIPGALRRQRIAAVLEEFDLGALRSRNMRMLSGGELRRIQLARCLLHQPELLILDEPSANLDSVWRLRLQERVRERARRDGTTVLWTSHDMREIEEATTRILLLQGGKIAADDHPQAFARRLTGEHLRIRVTGPVPTLQGAAGVIDTAWDGDWLVVHVDVAEERLPAVLRLLDHGGCKVQGVRVETATLEKAILKSNWGARVV
ncbi:MAG TPA: ABC transporter ATP-binding protein [Symbiobacteriaceae bacterium]|nr:ABC transporter ATP-binding protein [Symbiobacteriaceae bacterium]